MMFVELDVWLSRGANDRIGVAATAELLVIDELARCEVVVVLLVSCPGAR